METAPSVTWQPSARYQGGDERVVCQGSLTFRLIGGGLAQAHALGLEGIERKNQSVGRRDRSQIQI